MSTIDLKYLKGVLTPETINTLNGNTSLTAVGVLNGTERVLSTGEKLRNSWLNTKYPHHTVIHLPVAIADLLDGDVKGVFTYQVIALEKYTMDDFIHSFTVDVVQRPDYTRIEFTVTGDTLSGNASRTPSKMKVPVVVLDRPLTDDEITRLSSLLHRTFNDRPKCDKTPYSGFMLRKSKPGFKTMPIEDEGFMLTCYECLCQHAELLTLGRRTYRKTSILGGNTAFVVTVRESLGSKAMEPYRRWYLGKYD